MERLIAALERHFEAASTRRDPDDSIVAAAGQDLAEAFDAYDEALFEATEVATPLQVYSDDDFEDFEDDLDDLDDDDDLDDLDEDDLADDLDDDDLDDLEFDGDDDEGDDEDDPVGGPGR